MELTNGQKAVIALRLSKLIQSNLEGADAELHGMTLALLVSMYFADFEDPDIRKSALRGWLKLMRGLIENGKEAVEKYGGDAAWR